MARIPNFLTIIEDYWCINLSARAKQLKPATDLVTSDRQRRLAYVLDIFPGLYCQSMTLVGLQPKTTVKKPVLIVRFIAEVSEHHADTSDPPIVMAWDANVLPPTSTQSHRSTKAEREVMKGIQVPLPITKNSHDTENADNKTANDPQPHSKPSRYHNEVVKSREGAQEGRLPQPVRPASQTGRFLNGIIERFF